MPLSAVNFVQTLEIEEFDEFKYRRSMTDKGYDEMATVVTSTGVDTNKVESSNSNSDSLDVDKEQAFVDAGSLASFFGKLTAQDKEDVLNSTMLAQLAANKKHEREEDPENWYKSYMHVMKKNGWVIQEFQFKKYQSQQSSFKISDVVQQLLGDFNDQNLKKVVQATIKSLGKSEKGLKLFERKSSSEKGAIFQVLPCSVDRNGQVTAALLGFHIKVKEFAGTFFFLPWSTKSGSIELSYTAGTITLNKNAYSQVREEIKKRLRNHVIHFVHDLSI